MKAKTKSVIPVQSLSRSCTKMQGSFVSLIKNNNKWCLQTYLTVVNPSKTCIITVSCDCHAGKTYHPFSSLCDNFGKLLLRQPLFILASDLFKYEMTKKASESMSQPKPNAMFCKLQYFCDNDHVDKN